MFIDSIKIIKNININKTLIIEVKMEITRYQQTQHQLPDMKNVRKDLLWCVMPDRSIVSTGALKPANYEKTNALGMSQIGAGMILLGLGGASCVLSSNIVTPLALATGGVGLVAQGVMNLFRS